MSIHKCMCVPEHACAWLQLRGVFFMLILLDLCLQIERRGLGFRHRLQWFGATCVALSSCVSACGGRLIVCCGGAIENKYLLCYLPELPGCSYTCRRIGPEDSEKPSRES